MRWQQLWRWFLTTIVVMGVAATVILSEHPQGGIEGSLTWPDPATMPSEVQVIARGTVTRGITTRRAEHFQINNLPTGSYDLTIYAPGYRRIQREHVSVTEGQVLELGSLTLEYLQPSLNLYGTSRVFATNEVAKINLSSEGLERATLEIYPFSLATYRGTATLVSLADPYGFDFPASASVRKTSPLKTWEQGIPPSVDDWSTITLNLPKLTAGSYLIHARGRGRTGNLVEAEYGITISDLGLIQKQAPDQVLLSAVNLRTQEPLPNIALSVYDTRPPYRLRQTLTTDSQGLARWPLSDEQRSQSWVIFGQGEQDLQALVASSSYGDRQSYEFYTYTDRPLYRPGQTVYFRSIVRRRGSQGSLRPPSATFPVRVQANDAQGNPLYQATLQPNRFGTIQGSFGIPASADLGSYSLTLETEGDDSDYLSFAVEEYRKPEFAITVTPERPWVAQGGAMAVTISGEYLFGGPVANAQVHYRIYRSQDWGFRYDVLPRSPEEAFFASSLDEDRYSDYGGYGDLILEGDAITDAGGIAQVTLSNLLANYDWQSSDYFSNASVQQLRIEAEVTDISRRVVTASGRLRVTQGTTALFVDTDRYVANPGESVTATIHSYSYDQKPLATEGTVTLEQWQWQQDQYRLVRTVTTAPFRTEQGQGTASLTLPPDLTTGDYRLRVSGDDSTGGSDTTYLWVTGQDTKGWQNGGNGAIRVLADKTVYSVGDQARIVITSPLADAYALISLEGQTLYQAQMTRISGHTLTLTVPILATYQPNVFYKVLIVGPERQVYEGEAKVYVSPLDRFIEVQITPDKATYQPGEAATIRLQTRDAQQQPVSAEVSLGVVDEAIYLLRPDPTPDIRRFFYSSRYNRVSTSYSFPQQYPGGLDKLANQIRQDFRDTAAWFPSIVTDAQGQAQVTVPLPDNLTTWRLTARATTVDTRVGSALANLTVTKNLLVRLATPRFFRTQDQLALTAVVQNQTQAEQTVLVRLEVPTNLEVKGSLEQSLKIPAQGAQRVEWPVTVLAAGDSVVRVWAEGTTDRDAMQLTIPSQAFGSPLRQSFQGRGAASLPLEIPENLVPGSLQATLHLASNPVADVLGGLDYLVGYPYGCTEQTLSRFLPALAVQDLGRRVGIPLNSQTLNRIPAITTDALRRLKRLQHDDGGWGWWQWDDSNPYLTSYVLQGYLRAQEAGYPVAKAELERGRTYLEQTLAKATDLSGDTRMMVSYVLSLMNRGNPTLVRETPSDTLSTVGATYRILALLQTGQTAPAQAAFDTLASDLGLGKPTPVISWFQPALRWLGDPSSLWQRTHFGNAEIAGPLLEAATRLEDPRAATIASWLTNQRQGSQWDTTKATADALVGLSRYYQQQQQSDPPSYTATVALGDTPLSQWTPTLGDPYRRLSWTDRDLPPGTSSLNLQVQGTGDLYYTINVEGFLAAPAGSPIGGQSQGFTVQRRYFTLSPQGQVNGRLQYQETPLQGEVAAGTLVMAKVTVTTDQPRRYVMVEDPLPSGAEVTSLDARQLTGESNDAYGWDWFWAEQTIRDDRITFFTTQLPVGTHEFVYLFRPEIPGIFHVNPTQVEEMYDPAVFGQSQSQEVRVQGS